MRVDCLNASALKKKTFFFELTVVCDEFIFLNFISNTPAHSKLHGLLFYIEWRLISTEIVRSEFSILLQLSLKQEAPAEPEVVVTPKNVQRKRKTTHADPSYGSFFLRVGAIGEFFLKRRNDFYKFSFGLDIELGIDLPSSLFSFRQQHLVWVQWSMSDWNLAHSLVSGFM